MEVEQKLRELLSIMINFLAFKFSDEELNEIKDVIRYSDDLKELDEVKERLFNALINLDEDKKRVERLAENLIELIAAIEKKSSLEIKASSVEEALQNAVNELNSIKEKLECIEKERIDYIRAYVVDLVKQITEGSGSTDVKIIAEYTIDRIEKEPVSLFQPEVFRRIQDLILEKEKEIEVERSKLREQLKKVLRSIISTINSLADSEDMILGHLNEHLTDIEDVLNLTNLDEITERLTQLSAKLRETIKKTQRELKKTREELGKNAKIIEQLKVELEKYKEMAVVDELTGILNRRGILDMLAKEISRAERFKLPLSITMIDIDNFKSVNDSYGHLTGDKVLRAMAQIIKSNIRSIDLFGRYGGEEFLLVFPNTPKENAKIAAEKLRREIESHKFKYKNEEFRITISAGVAEYNYGDDVKSLISKADEALYKAKSFGKNRVEVY